MTDTARVRIGRVRLKSGGEVDLLPDPPKESPIIGSIREWAGRQADYVRPPDAFVAVSFWWDKTVSQHVYDAIWGTYVPELPHAFLPELTNKAVASAMTVLKAEDRMMRKLGYEPIRPDEPA